MWYNRIIQLILQSPLHGMLSGGVMLVSYTGHKSGRRYTLPVSFSKEEFSEEEEETERLWTVSLRKRIWWRSLRGDAKVTLRFKGKNRLARSEVLESEEAVREGLLQLLAISPVFGRYLEIALDEEGKPQEEAIQAAASRRVLVRFNLVD